MAKEEATYRVHPIMFEIEKEREREREGKEKYNEKEKEKIVSRQRDR